MNFYLDTPDGPQPLGYVMIVDCGNDVRLGFDMPANVVIVRDEIDDVKDERNKETVK